MLALAASLALAATPSCSAGSSPSMVTGRCEPLPSPSGGEGAPPEPRTEVAAPRREESPFETRRTALFLNLGVPDMVGIRLSISLGPFFAVEAHLGTILVIHTLGAELRWRPLARRSVVTPTLGIGIGGGALAEPGGRANWGWFLEASVGLEVRLRFGLALGLDLRGVGFATMPSPTSFVFLPGGNLRVGWAF